ncbi:hypothetical protein JNO63_06935 [Anaerococcus sp. mt242]|uniref:CAP domain-containing protein n=1 Tax=Anaerococcus sp. mt242 TaxID=2661917 RepID=UPI001931C390|nr:CAP domain-containing protein [Anaerococcus sp. mt242]MBM0046824.1 hypothetical protein [Anaerococcus sp. mt242]
MKSYKKLALSLALSFVLLGANPAFAAESRLDLGVDTGKVAFSEETFSLKQDEALKNEVLSEIRAIRSRLWDENILYTLEGSNKNGERLQDVAKVNGFSSKEAYVNGLTWSNNLERIAIQRAYEQTITGLSHNRPDGSDNSTAITKSGIYASAEILASSTQKEDPKKSFGQWAFEPSKIKNNKSEYQLLKESKGVSNSDNGHLHIILDPELKHIGYAALNTNSKWNYGVGVFDFNISNVNENSVNIVGNYNIYAGDIADAPKVENKTANPVKLDELSPESIQKLRNTVTNSKETIAGAKLLMRTMPQFVEKNGDKLNALIESSQKLIDRAEKILANYK